VQQEMLKEEFIMLPADSTLYVAKNKADY